MPVEAPFGCTLQCDGKGIALNAMGGCADNLLLVAHVCF